MAKNKKPKKRKQSSPGFSPEKEAEKALQILQATIDKIVEDPDVGKNWGEAQHALLKTKADRQDIMRIVASRDLDDLKKMAVALKAGETHLTPKEPVDAEPEIPVDPEAMKHAMRAFRKRIKFARLDDESKLGVGPMTGGKHSRINSILAPHEFPREVWKELARRGQLIDIGQGFYELAKERHD